MRGDIYEMLVRRLGFNDKNLLLFSEADYLCDCFLKRIDLIIGSDFTIDHQRAIWVL